MANVKKRILWTFVSLVVLWITYAVILRYLQSESAYNFGVIWLLYSNNPINILRVGMVIVIIFSFVKSQRLSQKVMLSVMSGYSLGFIAAVLFNVDSPDPLGINPDIMIYNNAWWIWLITLFAFVTAAISWEIISKILRQKSADKTVARGF